jgi:glycosyltransferase involved in cell wall biosynthesis
VQRVCFLIFNLEPGGLQINLLRFVLDSRKYFEITIVVKGSKNHLLENDFIKAGANVKYIKSGYLNVIAWFKYFKFFKNGGWVSVCDFSGNFAGVYMLLSKWAGIPNRVGYYGQSRNHFSSGIIVELYSSLVNQLVKKFSTLIISNSPQAMDYFMGKNWRNFEKVHLINNGVIVSNDDCETKGDIYSELNIPKQGIIILNAARFDKNKNQKFIIDVAELICNIRHDVYFVFCGKDTQLLKKEIESIGLKGRVFALGYRHDIGSIFKSSDLFFFPSISEGQPNALIEAIIFGLPFVASNIVEIMQIIPQQYHAQLIPPWDKDAAKEKLLEIIDGNIRYDVDQLRGIFKEEFNPKKRFQELRNFLTLYNGLHSKKS